jgi:hypothetical protein
VCARQGHGRAFERFHLGDTIGPAPANVNGI